MASSFLIQSPQIQNLQLTVLSVLKKCCATSFRFQIRNLLSPEPIFPYDKFIVFLWLLSRIFLFSLVFRSLIIMCVGMHLDVFGFPSGVFIYSELQGSFWHYSQRMTPSFSSKSASEVIWFSLVSTTYKLYLAASNFLHSCLENPLLQ